jgi:hypothetical protein
MSQPESVTNIALSCDNDIERFIERRPYRFVCWWEPAYSPVDHPFSDLPHLETFTMSLRVQSRLRRMGGGARIGWGRRRGR